MRWIYFILLFTFISCVPGEKTPNERGGDSAPFIPPPSPDDEEFIPNLPPTRNSGLGESVNLPQGSPDPIPFTPNAYSLPLSGSIQIETIPFDQDGRHAYDQAEIIPLKSAKIEVYNAETEELIESTYVRNGFYSFSAINTNIVYLKVYAESEQPIVRIKDNTNNKSLYQYDTQIFDIINTSIANFIINVGWNGSLFYANTGQPDGAGGTIDEEHNKFLGGYLKDSFSAPFAILNQYATITDKLGVHIANLQASQTGSSLGGINAKFQTTSLDVFWSPDNISTIGLHKNGHIGKAHYNPINNSIYLNGKIDVNTDEWDKFLQTELYAYFFLDNLSRSDLYSLDYNESAIMQPSQVFPHSFATVLTALLNEKDFYTEASGVRGLTISREVDLEKSLITNKEWYHVEGQRKLLWDMFDDVNEGLDYDSLSLEKLIEILVEPNYIRSSYPNSFFKFARLLRENNIDKNVYLTRILNFYEFDANWSVYGPLSTDSRLPTEFDEFNPMYEEFDDLLQTTSDVASPKPAQTLTVKRNSGNCELAGSEDYLKFYATTDRTVVQLTRDDFITVEIIKNGEIIWKSSSDKDETFVLDTFNNATNFIIGQGDNEENHYFIRARSHPSMNSATGNVHVKLHQESLGVPTENISNQFQLFTIGFDNEKRVDIPSYTSNCHPHATIERRRFKTAADNHVRLTLDFDNKDKIEYKVIIDGEILVESTNSTGVLISHIFEFDDPPNTNKYLEIQMTSPDNLFQDHGVVYDLEYLPF